MLWEPQYLAQIILPVVEFPKLSTIDRERGKEMQTQKEDIYLHEYQNNNENKMIQSYIEKG